MIARAAAGCAAARRAAATAVQRRAPAPALLPAHRSLVNWSAARQPFARAPRASSLFVDPAFAGVAAAPAPARAAAAAAPQQPAAPPAWDLRSPASWYPAARSLKRRIVLHVGPTNSGKTFHALRALRAADTGVYCGPLRLLAWEVCERLREEGTGCHLVTGQEREMLPGAQHVSCTVEMVDVSRFVHAAVLDEIQMIGDADRGWAWTRVLLGLPAAELHCCGDASAVPAVRRLLAQTGDDLIIHEYKRLSPLQVASNHVARLGQVRAGDCIVAFSRADLFSYKKEIESSSNLRCGVIYGALPPAVRREQARRFNQVAGDERTDVLVATDAVGMGLNLQIGRIIFSKLDKFDGVARRMLTISEMKQIGGRAGRFGSAFEAGEVTGMKKRHLPVLTDVLHATTPKVQSAGLLPTLEQLERYAASLVAPDLFDSDHAFDYRASLSGPLRTDALPHSTPSPHAAEPCVGNQGGHASREGAPTSASPHVLLDEDVMGLTHGVGGVARDVDAAVDAAAATPLPREVGSPYTESSAFSLQAYDSRVRSSNSVEVQLAADAAQSEFGFSKILVDMLQNAIVDHAAFFLCEYDDMVRIARQLDDVSLSFRTRYIFCMSPVDIDDPLCVAALHKYARKFVRKGRVSVGLQVPTKAPTNPHELRDLESAHAVFDLYIWLARRFPQQFWDLEGAQALSQRTQELIEVSLEVMGDMARQAGAAQRTLSRGRSTLSRRLRASGDVEDEDEDSSGGESDDDVAAARVSTEYWRSMVRSDEGDEDAADLANVTARKPKRRDAKQSNVRRVERRIAHLSAEDKELLLKLEQLEKRRRRISGKEAARMVRAAFEAGDVSSLSESPAFRQLRADSIHPGIAKKLKREARQR